MDNQFLDAYIHLEKICSEMYGMNHRISKYIEDMENTTQSIQTRIPQWTSTYKKLKEIRWERNQLVHEGNIEYDDTDEAWLRAFYQQILISEDPLSIRRRIQVANSNSPTDKARKTEEYEVEFDKDTEYKETRFGLILVGAAILFILALVVGI